MDTLVPMARQKMVSVTAKDLVWETKRGSGKGGQNRNKRDTAVRVVHPPSGAVGEAQDERGQLDNKRLALKRLANSVKFRQWVSLRHADLVRGETIEQEVARDLSPGDLKPRGQG